MEKRNILRAICDLEKASLLRVNRIRFNGKDKKHNIYYPTDTRRWDNDTDIELDNVSSVDMTLIA